VAGRFQNARHLLDALKRRLDKPVRAESAKARHQRRQAGAQADAPTFPHAFHLYRQSQAQRARVLNSLLVVVQPDYVISLRRAPDWRLACNEAWGRLPPGPRVVACVSCWAWSARTSGARRRAHALLGTASASIRTTVCSRPCAASTGSGGRSPAAGSRQAWLDIGVGTGVLSALLLQRGVQRVVATDLSPVPSPAPRTICSAWAERPGGAADLPTCSPKGRPA
jgi:hypothetical protein